MLPLLLGTGEPFLGTLNNREPSLLFCSSPFHTSSPNTACTLRPGGSILVLEVAVWLSPSPQHKVCRTRQACPPRAYATPILDLSWGPCDPKSVSSLRSLSSSLGLCSQGLTSHPSAHFQVPGRLFMRVWTELGCVDWGDHTPQCVALRCIYLLGPHTLWNPGQSQNSTFRPDLSIHHKGTCVPRG